MLPLLYAQFESLRKHCTAVRPNKNPISRNWDVKLAPRLLD